MITHYLYNVQLMTTYAFMEGMKEGDPLTVLKTVVRATPEDVDLHSEVLSCDDAEKLWKKLVETGYCTFEDFAQKNPEFYGAPCRPQKTACFHSGLAKWGSVEKMKEAFFRSYHPAGYGSYVEVFWTGLNDVVFWKASRASSCD